MRTKITILSIDRGTASGPAFAGSSRLNDPTTQTATLPYAPPTRLHSRQFRIPLTSVCICLDECG